jgi:hypothetical protein
MPHHDGERGEEKKARKEKVRVEAGMCKWEGIFFVGGDVI